VTAKSVPRIGILSGREPGTEFPSAANHKAYADAHGFTYIHCSWRTKAHNPYLNKFEWIGHYLHLFDWVFWIDDDAFFVDFSKSLLALLPGPDQVASFCKSPNVAGRFTFLSSGQFFLSNSGLGKRLVEDVLAVSLPEVESWWKPELGMFTGGDQDALVYLLLTRERYRGRYQLRPYQSFNSRVEDIQANLEQVFLLHLTGPRPVKIRKLQKAAKHLQRSPSLIPLAKATTARPKDRSRLGILRSRIRILKRLFYLATVHFRLG
jgi:hypothetical protein